MRGKARLILAAALLGLGGSGCGISAITIGIIVGTQGGGSSGSDNGRPAVVITRVFPPGSPIGGVEIIDFTVSDREGDPVDILVEVSQDGGATFLPARDVTGTTTGLPTTPAGTPGTITWGTYADVGSTVQNDVRLRITPFDPRAGIAGSTGNLTVDNTDLPDIYEVDNDAPSANPLVPAAAAQVHSIHEPGDVDYVSIQVTSISERYTLETSNLTGGDTVLSLFDTDGMTLLVENDDKAGGGLGSRIDFIFPATGLYFARVQDGAGGYLYTYDLSLAVVAPSAPSAVVETPVGAVHGGVTITYVVSDPDENAASITVEFSQNGGGTFAPATERVGPPSEGTTGLATSAAGETHQFVWDSVTDIGQTDQTDIQIRITPFDTASGTPSTTASFHVDDVAPRIVSVEYLDIDLNGPDYGDLLDLTFSEEVVLGSATPSAFALPVAGDSLGDPRGIVVSPGAGVDQVTIELGESPIISVAGTFDPAAVGPGSPSGLDVAAAFPSNAITDLAGNEAENYGQQGADDDGVDVGSQDTSAPFMASASAQALSGPYNDEVEVVFNEPVIAADAVQLSKYSLESPAGSPVDMGTAAVFYNPVTLTSTISLTDTGPQMDNLQYNGSFRVSVTGIRDTAGNLIPAGSPIAGNVGGDGFPPILLSADQNLNAGPGGDTVDLLFDEALDPATASNPVNYGASGGPSPQSATLQPDLVVVRVIFDAAVTPGTTTVDVANVLDLAGNPIVPVTGRPVGVADLDPPGILGSVATAISGLANDRVTVTFDEPVAGVTAGNLANYSLESPAGTPIDWTSSTISFNAPARMTTITLTNTGAAADNLQFGATARVTVSNVEDLQGNVIPPGSFVDGTVAGDDTPPRVLGVIQDLGADPGGAALLVDFDEALETASGEMAGNYTVSGGITILSAALSPGAESVALALDAPVISGRNTFSASSVKDAAGNVMNASAILQIGSTDSTPPLATIDQPGNGEDVPQNVLVSGTASDDHSTITSVKVNGTDAATADGYATWSASITLPLGTQLITVSTRDFNGNADPAAASITVNVKGNTPPKATVTTPAGTQFGDVPIHYRLIDVDLDPVSIVVSYSTDGGAFYFPATESTDPLSEGTVGLSSSPDPGTAHVFVWDSLADMGATFSGAVRIRILPSDAAPGTPGVTGPFTVNNAGDPPPFVVCAIYEDTDGNGVDAGDRITVTFNEPVVLNVSDTSPFALPVSGDTFGLGAGSAAGFAPTDIRITLGTGPFLTVPGRYSTSTPGMPSGIDISLAMPAGAIQDGAGNDAVPTASTWLTGSGSDGSFDSATYNDGDISGISRTGPSILVDTDDPVKGGVYEFTSFDLSPAETLRATGSNPLVIRATGSVTIGGTIDLTGIIGVSSGTGQIQGGGGSAAAAGGDGGGGGRSNGVPGSPGQGPGGGGGGETGPDQPGGGGGGASYGTPGGAGVTAGGGTGGQPGASYGDPYLFPLRGGSGGGGGGAIESPPGGGAGGGGGGGAIRISSGGGITIDGLFAADGGAGGDSDGTAAGGAGSGGAIHLQAIGDITVNGWLFARGGLPGTAASPSLSDGGAGGNGRIRLEDGDGVIGGTGTIVPTPILGTPTVDLGGGFRASDDLLERRRGHSVVLLRDGRVLIGGGVKDQAGAGGLTAMVYDPGAETVQSAGPMQKALSDRRATVLPSGDVLFTGGYDQIGGASSQAEIYRVGSGAFEALPGMNASRAGHTATALPNGTVLLAGGGSNSAEIFVWTMETFTPVLSPMTDTRTGHTATCLGDLAVLIAGGEDSSGSLSSTEWFDLRTQSFTAGSDMKAPRAYHVAAPLPTGGILVAGGEDGGAALGTAETYDPILDTFTLLAGALSEPRSRVGSVGVLPDGTILIPGGGGRGADVFVPWNGAIRRANCLMKAPRIDATVTTLPSGRVLVVGGWDPIAGAVLDGTELFTLEPGGNWMTMLPTGPPASDRGSATAIRMPNGDVLLAGGNAGAGSISSTEIYNLGPGTFQPGNPMGGRREGHCAVLLATGEILVMAGTDTVGGTDLDTAERYDPDSGLWTPTAGPLFERRTQAQAIVLWTGEALICGGQGAGSPINTAETYNPLSDSFTSTGNMTNFRMAHAVAPLPDGRILVVGGFANIIAPLDTAEIYDPRTRAFLPTAGSMAAPRLWPTATLLPDGGVLLAGGGPDIMSGQATTEIYDPGMGTFSAGPDLGRPRVMHSATLLPNGTVLIAGGRANPAGTVEPTTEIFSPQGGIVFPAPSMGAPRYLFPLVPLGDGRILAVGEGPGADLYTP